MTLVLPECFPGKEGELTVRREVSHPFRMRIRVTLPVACRSWGVVIPALLMLLSSLPLAALGAATFPAPVLPDVSNGLRCSVAPVGDVNGDGVPDFALARRGPGPAGSGKPDVPVGPGIVWIFSGTDGHLLRTLPPPSPCEDFGRALEDVGDTNGDGHRDLAISGGNRVWLFSGVDGAVLHEIGSEFVGTGFGDALAGGRDIDGDGSTDIAVYRSGEDYNNVYRVACVFLFSGRTAKLIRALACEPLESEKSLERSSFTLVPGNTLATGTALVPDWDGDGLADVVVSVVRSKEPPAASGDVVAIEVWSSKRWTRLQRIDITGWPWIIRVLGDVNDDQVPDLLASAPDVFVSGYSGLDGALLHTQDYTSGYMYAEGTSLDVLGDVNDDGIPDFLVGANEDTLDCDPGVAVVHSGADGTGLRTFFGGDYDSTGCGVGVDACVLGDANGDGICDIVVHMPRLHEARVLSGKDLSLITTVNLSDLEPVELR